MMATKIDQNIYNGVRTRADTLMGMYSARNKDFETYEKMYLMEWSSAPKTDDVKITISPDARNAVLGAKRLLVATDPIFSVPDDQKDHLEKSEEIEQTCGRMWTMAGRAARMPIHYSAVESAVLYGECHIAITSTQALVDMAKTPIMKTRAERLAKLTPYIFEVWNPKFGYPEFDVYGLSAYLRQVKVRIGELPARFGQMGEEYAIGRESTEEVTLNIWYDVENYVAWVDEQAFVAEPHKLPFIPVSVSITEGSRLFDKPEQQRQPLLYGIAKSGFWERENLNLTVLYTNVYHIGLNPTFLHTAPPSNPDKQLRFDASTPGGVIDMEPGESFVPMVTKGILDPSFNAGLDIAERKFAETTIFRQALGEPMTGSPAFSTVALMSQSGRLPLITYQKMAGEAIGNAMELALQWYRDSGGKQVVGYCKPSDVPDNLRIDCKLDINLPQDKLQQANIATMLTRDGVASTEWVRKEILNIEQSQNMDEDIQSERAFGSMTGAYIQARGQTYVQQILQQMQAQQGVPPGAQPPVPPEGSPPGAPPMPPDVNPMGGPQSVGAEGPGFNPGMGGLPPNMAGMIPPGEQTAPPELGMPPGMGGGF